MVDGEIPTNDLLVVSDISPSNFQLISDYSPEHPNQNLLCCFTGTNGYVLVYEKGIEKYFEVATNLGIVGFWHTEIPLGYEWVLADVAEKMW